MAIPAKISNFDFNGNNRFCPAPYLAKHSEDSGAQWQNAAVGMDGAVCSSQQWEGSLIDKGVSWDRSGLVGVSRGIFWGRFFCHDLCPWRGPPGYVRSSGGGFWRARDFRG